MRDLFSKETNPDVFVGLTITLSMNGIKGKILGTFGKSGKLKVRLESELPSDAAEQKKFLGSDVQLYYKKSVWEDKKNKIKNKFKFN